MKLIQLRTIVFAFWLAALIIVALLLGACNALPDRLIRPDLGRVGFGRADELEITELALWSWPVDEAIDAHLQTVADAYVEAAPGVSVTLTLPVDDYYATLDLAFATDAGPDLFLMDLHRLPQLAAAGLLAPLPADQVDAADLYPLLRDGATIDGQLYCMPDAVNTLALLYNKTLFDAAGIAYPDASWRWDDLRAAAEAISGLPTVNFFSFGLAITPDVTRWLPFLYQAGGELVDATGWPMLGSQAANAALEFYTGLITDGPAVEPGYLETGWGGEALGAGRVGMVIEGVWAIPYLDNERPLLEYGVAPLPGGPAGRGTVAFGACWAVAADSDDQAAAIDLLNALTSTQAMQERIELSPSIPARPSLARIWANAYPQLTPFLDGLDDARLWRLSPELADLPEIVNDALHAVFDGDLDVDEAQAEMDVEK